MSLWTSTFDPVPNPLKVRVIVRAICVSGRRVLLARANDCNHYSVPGGGIEKGEDPPTALLRELREELGIDGVVGCVLDEFPHQWDRKGVVVREHLIVFRVSLPLRVTADPLSFDSRLQFSWQTLADLAHLDLRPTRLRQVIDGALRDAQLGKGNESRL